VIPINQSLLFIRPLYLEAERTAQPQFKKAIVVFANRAVMRDSLREALVELFGAAPETLEANAGQTPPPGQPEVPGEPGQPPAITPELQQLFDQLRATLTAANDAKARGSFAEFEAKYNEALEIARDIEAALGGATATQATPAAPAAPAAPTTPAPPPTTTTTAASA
jgi:uncharacterized membrane protein (UPF0182 family)